MTAAIGVASVQVRRGFIFIGVSFERVVKVGLQAQRL
jgi:hypothetical protein